MRSGRVPLGSVDPQKTGGACGVEQKEISLVNARNGRRRMALLTKEERSALGRKGFEAMIKKKLGKKTEEKVTQ